jgi:riboflavin kinase
VAPDVGAAVIVPDVTDHAADVLEVVAPVHVRRALGLRDGDAVTLEVTESPYTASSL